MFKSTLKAPDSRGPSGRQRPSPPRPRISRIRATANSNENDEDYDGLIVFKNYVEAASNGAIEVELFIGTQLCSNGAECLAGRGRWQSIDVYISTSGGASGIFPYVQVLDLPYLMASDRIAETVLAGDFTRKMREMALRDSGGAIRLMTIGNTGGWRNFANTQRRMQTPGDMEGLKIRTVVADLPQELVKRAGRLAHPDPVAGAVHQLPDRRGRRVQERHHRHHGHEIPRCGPAIRDAGRARLYGRAVVDEQREVHVHARGSAPRRGRRLLCALQQATFASPKRKSIQAYEDFVAGGGDLYVPTPEEKAAFKEAAAPVYDWFKANINGGEEIFDALVAAVAEAEAEIDAGMSMDIK